MGSYISKSEQSRDVADFNGKTEKSDAVADSVNTFGAKLLVEYRNATDTIGNMVFSPLNLATTFHLVYQGAGGKTKTQINNLLNFSNPGVKARLNGKHRDIDKRGAARMACRLYVDNSVCLLSNYVRRAGANRVLSVDFANKSESIRTEVNKWVRQETHGLIPKLVSERDITSSTILALVNALYFKGKWKLPFDPNNTETGVFHGVNGDQSILYMTRFEEFLLYREVPELGGIMFQFLYEEKDFALYVLLPNEVDGWKQAEQAYPEHAGKIFSYKFLVVIAKSLKLPKWEMDFSFESLKDGLMSLGISELFTPEANLSAMTKSSSLMLNSLIHKAKIIVNEEGTEAAAASGCSSFKCRWNYEPRDIIVNRPFLYFVVDRSDGTVLFQGTQTSFL